MPILKTQLLNFFKEHDTFHLGVALQHLQFKTKRGGYYSPANIDRTVRLLFEEGRLEKRIVNGLVEFKYKPSKYEELHASYQMQI